MPVEKHVGTLYGWYKLCSNIEEAMKYYLEGKSDVEKTEDYKTGYLIMSSLWKQYLYRRLYEYALEACRMTCKK